MMMLRYLLLCCFRLHCGQEHSWTRAVTVIAGGNVECGMWTVTWTREGRRLLRHPREAGIPYGGGGAVRRRGRGNSSFPSFRGRRPWNPPVRGNAVRCRGRGDLKSPSFRGVRQHPVESPIEGGAVRCRYPGGTIWGIASSQSPLGSASALRRKLLSLPCSSFSAAIRFAGFASEAGAAERENDSR